MRLEDIFTAARERRWEYGRRGKGRGGREVADSNAGRYGPHCDRKDTGGAWVDK